jgi:hypothetical protein
MALSYYFFFHFLGFPVVFVDSPDRDGGKRAWTDLRHSLVEAETASAGVLISIEFAATRLR